ncbi:type IV secretory system conjugative DNA transfer family protein [Synechococcus moorigangaii CMS01]|nr:type IV secretory system conjugative DNA transfer family protein [Synechococcus moorigangaii CMS01]
MSNPQTNLLPSPTPQPDLNAYVSELIFSPLGLLLLGCGVLLAFMTFKGDRRKSTSLGKGKLATPQQVKNGALRTLRQVQGAKRADVGLWVGTPKGSVFSCQKGKWSIDLCYDPQTLYLSDCTSGISVLGGAGSGKSFSALNPLFLSGLAQGIPGLYFDIKYSTHSPEDPSPTALIAGYAKRLNYEVGLFAPGKQESLCCNVLDFIRHPEDAAMARQIAKVLYLNLNPQALKGGSNPFFTEATTSFLAGVMLLAKQTDCPDLVMCRALTRLPSPQLQAIVDAQPEAIRMVFDAVVDVFGVEETYGSIKATFANLLSGLLMPDLLPAICGQTTISLDLDERKILICGSDAERGEIVNPILATVIHLLTNRNLLKPRQRPFLLWLDEISQIYLPSAEDWPNIHRSAGLVMAIGVQFPEVLEKRYGKDGASRLLKACATQLVFQANDIADAEKYSKSVGNRDVEYDTKGRSRQKGGNSTSHTEHKQSVAIIDPSEILQLSQGKAIIWNRGIGDRHGSRIPLIQTITIPNHDLKAFKESTADWEMLKEQFLKTALPHFTQRDFQRRDFALISTYRGICPELEAAINPIDQEIDLDQLRQDAQAFRAIDVLEVSELLAAVF